MSNDNIVLITGATGHQGGATLRHLAQHGGFRLRAMTRHPDGEPAQALRKLGAEVVGGDLDDVASLERAVTGAWGVYSVQNTWEAGVAREEEQGKRLAKVARERGVRRFVYASVGSAHKATGIPHFDNKFRIEQTVKGLGFPSYAIVRPVYFMENLLAPWSVQGDKLTGPMDPGTKLQMVAADDIGRFGARAFIEADRHANAEVDIAGDAVTMVEAATGLSEITGKTVMYQRIPLEMIRQNSEDMAIMFSWFEKVGYSADIAGLERSWGVRPRTFREWVVSQKKH